MSRHAFIAAGLMMAAVPSQAFAQLSEGPCANGPDRFEEDIRALLFGTWEADVSVANEGERCRVEGRSVWKLYSLFDHPRGSISGERELTVKSAHPAGCEFRQDSGFWILLSSEEEGGRCSTNVSATYFLSHGGRQLAPITRLERDSFTVLEPDGRQSVYRRRRGAPPESSTSTDSMKWKRSCGISPGVRRFIETSSNKGGPGSEIRLRAMMEGDNGWGAAHALPMGCIDRWEVSDAKLARLGEDGKTLLVSPTARRGKKVTVSYLVDGERVEQTIRIVRGKRGSRS